MKRQIRGSRAIVTGASSGIGQAVAEELARQGAKVVITARREERLRQVADAIVAQGGQAQIVVGDVSDPAVREKTLDVVRTAYGGLDILVNNAGLGAMGRFDRSNSETLRRVMEVNFFSLVEMTRLALPVLKQGRRPIIVNVSSILGRRGVPHNSEYAASKFAVHGFSESLRAELARERIDVLVVSPGTTETEFFDRVIQRNSKPAWPEHTPVSAGYVARKTVQAIRQGRHEIVPYTWGKVLCWLNRLSPGLVDRLMARYA